MENTQIFDKIKNLDSLKQKRLFLIHKYNNLKIPKSFLIGFEEFKNYKFESESINIFDIYKIINKDETKFKLIMRKYYFSTHKYEKKGKLYTINELNPTDILAFSSEFVIYYTTILEDVIKFNTIEDKILELEKDTININGEYFSLKVLSEYYSKLILSKITDEYRKDKRLPTYDLDEELSTLGVTEFEELSEELGIDKKIVNKIKNASKKMQKEIAILIWKYKFFKLVQKSIQKGYILSYKDLQIIYDIIEDLKNNKVVLLTGDTGSGKTELARFICNQYLGKDYVFVSGSKALEVSDLTLDKVVTSKGIFDTDVNIVTGEKKLTKGLNDTELQKHYITQQAKQYIDELMKTKEFKDTLIRIAKENQCDEEYIQELQNLKFEDFKKKFLFTEYHYMGLYLAANAGIPCIIDEVNIIRPEVFMALNDILTRKPGNKIQLPNGLEPINVKEGFCIILTGNDPKQNNKVSIYKSGRYEFDEASYNRFKVYAKNYRKQIIVGKKENTLDKNIEQVYDYLNENELYGTIIMMMFNTNTKLNTSGKYGFEIMKTDFAGNYLDKQSFFETLKKLAYGISTIQNVFMGNNIILSGKYKIGNIKEMLGASTFSMRNLLDVLEGYQGDTLPLDFHIYNKYIKKASANKDAQYVMLAIFNQVGFFGNLITNDIDQSIDNIEKWIRSIQNTTYVDETKIDENKTIVTTKKSIRISRKDISQKIIITKQDIYEQYFEAMLLSDNFFKDEINTIKDISTAIQDKESSGSDNNTTLLNDSRIEITEGNILEIIDEILNNNNLSNIEINIYYQITILCNLIKEKITKGNINNIKFGYMYSILLDISNMLNNIDDDIDDDIVVKINKNISTLIDYLKK